MVEVFLSDEAAEQFKDLQRPIKGRVERIFARLRDWPEVSGARPLRGDLAGHYRMRTGDYRVQFRIEGGTIVVEKVGHRDGFYED